MLTRGEEWCADMWRGHARAVQKEKKTLLWENERTQKMSLQREVFCGYTREWCWTLDVGA